MFEPRILVIKIHFFHLKTISRTPSLLQIMELKKKKEISNKHVEK